MPKGVPNDGNGGGRKPGSIARVLADRIAKPGQSIRTVSESAILEARAKGELPHEFLARVARGEKIDTYQPTVKERLDAACAAAPYFAPKLAQIEQRTEITVRHVISAEPLTEDQWLITHTNSEPMLLPNK